MKELLEYFYENGYIRLDKDQIAKTNKVLNNVSLSITKQLEYKFIDSLNQGIKKLD